METNETRSQIGNYAKLNEKGREGLFGLSGGGQAYEIHCSYSLIQDQFHQNHMVRYRLKGLWFNADEVTLCPQETHPELYL